MHATTSMIIAAFRKVRRSDFRYKILVRSASMSVHFFICWRWYVEAVSSQIFRIQEN